MVRPTHQPPNIQTRHTEAVHKAAGSDKLGSYVLAQAGRTALAGPASLAMHTDSVLDAAVKKRPSVLLSARDRLYRGAQPFTPRRRAWHA